MPVIDLAPFFSGTDEGKRLVADQVKNACENIGFFVVTNHGVPDDLVSRMVALSRSYFDLPREEKMKLVALLIQSLALFFWFVSYPPFVTARR